MNPSDLLPHGVSLIECQVGEVPNRLPLLWGERPILIDTGLKEEPETVIVPALRASGKDPAHLRLLINSHADVDHNGGNASMLSFCPEVRTACGEQDRALVESLQVLWEERWNLLAADHGIAYSEADRAMLGPGTRVDWVLRDGDVLNLGDGRTLQVVTTPGHSLGHLAFLLRPERILFAGDAVQGQGVPNGGQVTPPFYLDPDVYLGTLQKVSRLKPNLLVTCHWGSFQGGEIKKFLDFSRRFVERVDQAVRQALVQDDSSGLTIRDLTFRVSRSIGLWEENNDINFTATVHGHLQRALRQGWARQAGRECPYRFVKN